MIKYFMSLLSNQPIMVDPTTEHSMTGYMTALANHPKVSELMASANEDEFWFASDDWRFQFRPYHVKQGVLYIPVMGILLSGFPWQIGNFATGYNYIDKAIKRGWSDPEVKSIALVINSGGGHVSENFDLVDMIYNNRGKKPLNALVFDYAASAAYNIASAADYIYCARSAYVGSIGVVMAHIDASEAMKTAGLKITYIYAAEHKVDGNPNQPLPDSVAARWQNQVEVLYSEFASTVARNRGIDVEDVRGTKSLTFSAAEATSKGLVDSIATLDDAMNAIVDAITIKQGDTNMSNEPNTPATFTQEQVDAAVAAAIATANTTNATATATLAADTLTAAQTRISAIVDSDEGKKRPKAALAMAIDTNMASMDANAVIALLGKLDPEGKPNAAGAEFNASMNANGGANLESGDDDDGNGGNPDDATSLRNLASSFGLGGFRPKK